MFKLFKWFRRNYCLSVMGWDDAAYLAAAAATSAYSANQANSAAAGNAYTSNMVNMANQVQNQGFNANEANLARQFNKDEAGKARDATLWANREAQQFNSAEAAANRDWQERMSNTAYQRAVGDMKSAGLNPMLAYSQGGASAGGGSAASISGATQQGAAGPAASSGTAAPAVTPVFTPSLAGAFSAGSAMSVQQAQVENIKADTLQKEATVPKIVKETKNVEQQTENLKEQVNLIREQTTKTGYEGNKSKFESYMTEYANDVWHEINELDIARKKGEIGQLEASTKLMKIEEKLKSLMQNEAKRASDQAGTGWARGMGYANDIGKVLGSAVGIGRALR